GIVVLILCVTGCLFVFSEEIANVVYKSERFVTPGAGTLPLSTLQQTAQAALGKDQPINYFTTSREPGRTWEFTAYSMNDSAITYAGSVNYYRTAYVNPYTGRVTGVSNDKWEFFHVVKYIHWSLLLNTPYGQPIVGWSTVIFVVLLITGLIMWWPKKWNRKTRDDSFTIRWKARFKRLNYDLHNVLGFYSLLVALVLGLTGMVFAFRWFMAVVYVLASGTTTPPTPAPALKSQVVTTAPAVAGLDLAYQQALQLIPDARRFGVSPAEGKDGVITIGGYRGKETFYNYDDLTFDQYSGKLLYRSNYAQRNRGEKLVSMNYDIHVGAIAGLPGKIIAFMACLVCTSLPVTGFIIWWGKRKK
ncbi:MAG TPA: PepSY-associated TM helix domain-containing protein, partial [Chitinophaga sp.]